MATWLRPTTLEDALKALAADAANRPDNALDRLVPLAGGTDYFPAVKTRQAWFQPSPRRILDLSAIGDLAGVVQEPGVLRIGALATWTAILDAPLHPAFDGLKQASRQVGGVQIQNRGTVVGNICNASPAADGVPPLLALDAQVELASLAGRRRLPLSQFILGNRRTALQRDELVTAVLVPDPLESEHSIFLKLGARAYLVISIASVAANIALDAKGRILGARIAVGACSAAPQRLALLEQRLLGETLEAAPRTVDASMLAALDPIDDVRATAVYRRDAAATLVRRALAGLAMPQERAA